MQRIAPASPSSHISRFSAGSMLNAPNSAAALDSPVPKLGPTFRHEVEHRYAARQPAVGWLNGGGVCTMPCPRRMFFVRCDAAARKTSGARRVAVLLEEVVLHLPDVFDSERVGELDLLERVLEKHVFRVLGPGARELVLVEDAELHPAARPSVRCVLLMCPRSWRLPFGTPVRVSCPVFLRQLSSGGRIGRPTGSPRGTDEPFVVIRVMMRIHSRGGTLFVDMLVAHR